MRKLTSNTQLFKVVEAKANCEELQKNHTTLNDRAEIGEFHQQVSNEHC